MSRSVGIGMVGAGFLAETRARCYGRIPGRARIAGVVARTSASARDYAERHGIPTVFPTLDAMLEDPAIEIVDLAVPNHLHRPFAETAAKAGRHVVCTKPLSAYVGQDLAEGAGDAAISTREPRRMLALARADAEAMVAAAEAHDVRLMYGENWVYAPSVTRMRGLLAAAGGVVLEMRGWESHSGSHSPYAKTWRWTGGGALLRLGAHPIGAMLLLKREEGLRLRGRATRPVSVTAEVGDLTRNPGFDPAEAAVASGWKDVENWGCAIIAFEDGSRGVAYGSDNMLGGMESRLQVMGSNCHLEANLSPSDLLRAYAPRESVFEDEYLMEKLDTTAGWSTPMPSEDWTSGQLAMCEDFVAAVAEDRDAIADGRLGADVVNVVYSAYVSAREGRRVSLVPDDPSR